MIDWADAVPSLVRDGMPIPDVVAIRLAIAALPPRERIAVALRYAGCSYAELAGRLGIRPQVAHRLLRRAARRLAEAGIIPCPRPKP